MKKHHILVCFTLILTMACKTLSVQNKHYQTTTQKVVLGSIGTDETFVLEKTYGQIGIPNYTYPIKVQMTPLSFTKTTFKTYNEALKFQPIPLDLKYIDSLPTKPKFLNIETVDKVGLINLLNDKSNVDIKNYLLNQTTSHVVTNISVVFNESDMNDLQKAEEVFISQIGLKTVGLELYTNGKVTRTINFNDGVVFAYRAASICWKENDKHQLEIVDLVEGDTGCPRQTYSSANRAKKKLDYFKF